MDIAGKRIAFITLGCKLNFSETSTVRHRLEQAGGVTVDEKVVMAVQVLGKLKGTIEVPTDSDEATVVAAAMAMEKVQRLAEGKKLVKTILVPNKLVNLILK